MEYNVIYQNSSDFFCADRSIIEDTLKDVAAVAFDSKSVELKITKNKESHNIECQISVVKNTENLISEISAGSCLTEALESAKNNILDKILQKNVHILSNAA